jgi:hypothetical protein
MTVPIQGWTEDPEVIRFYNELLVAYYRKCDEFAALETHLRAEGMGVSEIRDVILAHLATVKRDFFPFAGQGSVN